MALSEAEIAKCAEWCKSPAHKWQVLNRGEWKYQFHPKTLVRYVEEAKMDEHMVEILLEYLCSDDCKETLQLYGQSVHGEWTPIRAWYEISNKAVGSVHGVRLYHAMQIEPDASADGPYLIEDGCAYRVSWTYYWDRAEVGAAPASTSGISYHIVNLSRDQETGRFSYAVEKRERVQQDIPEYLTSTDAFRDVKEEAHFGVRGDLDVGGKQASVSNGRTVTRKVTKNSDCTHDVHNTITQDKAVPEAEVTVQVGVRGTVVTTVNRNMPAPASTDGLEPGESVRNQKTDSKLWNQTIREHIRNVVEWLRGTCRKTIFAHSHSETTNVATDPGFEHAVEAADGVIHEVSVHRTEDGYDITDSTTTEKPVQKSHEAVHVGLSGKTRSVTHRNQPSPAPEPTDIGESVENSRTEGGLWNVTIRTLVKNALVKIGDACSKTVFQHSHSNTKVQGSDPGESDVSSASGGVIHERRVSRTSDGAYQISDSTTTELPVGDASEATSIGLDGTVKTTHRRNQPSKAPDPTDIGESVENTKTPGGLWNHTIRKRVLKSLIKLGENCRKTLFSHSHSKSTVQGGDPGFDHVAEAANGIIRDKRVSRTSTGAYRVDESETTEKPVSKSSERIEKTLDGTVRVTTNRNQPSPAPEPTDIGESVENSRTEGGLWNQTIRTHVKGALVKLAEACSVTIFAHRHSKTKVQSGNPGFSHAADAGGGKIHTQSVSLTSSGSYRIEESEVTEKPVSNAIRIARMTLNGLSVRVVNRNQRAPLPDPEKVGESVSNSKTDGGLYNTEKTTEGAKPAGLTREDCSRDNFTHHHSVVKNEAEAQDPETAFTTGKIVRKSSSLNSNGTANNTTDTTTAVPSMQKYHYTDSTGATRYVVNYRNQDREYDTFPDTAHHVNLTDHINNFGLHDGSLTYTIGGITDWSVSAANLKFIKYGPQAHAYETDYRGKRNRLHHRKYTLQVVWKYGDAYTDYVADALKADPGRNTSGVIATKLLGKWTDTNGNLCCECVFVNLIDREEWKRCTNACDHNAFFGGDNIGDVAKKMISDHVGGTSQRRY